MGDEGVATMRGKRRNCSPFQSLALVPGGIVQVGEVAWVDASRGREKPSRSAVHHGDGVVLMAWYAGRREFQIGIAKFNFEHMCLRS